jgi:hypothetical protein
MCAARVLSIERSTSIDTDSVTRNAQIPRRYACPYGFRGHPCPRYSPQVRSFSS